ncbi:MAG: BMC domain-containing protein [candidate division KSB1 bacterium]|nr:BMC domain-containing protein [candidate division KSB1 bacterium]
MPDNVTIGVVELSSIYKGFEVQDTLLKRARVEKLLARTICSGKYLILVKGEIGDVETAMQQARETGGFAIVLAETVSNVHPDVLRALSGTGSLETPEAPGLLIIETFSVAAAIKAADIAVDEADINLLRIHAAMAIGGKGMILATGDMEALQSAADPAIEYLKQDGCLAGFTLLSNPHQDLLKDLV